MSKGECGAGTDVGVGVGGFKGGVGDLLGAGWCR